MPASKFKNLGEALDYLEQNPDEGIHLELINVAIHQAPPRKGRVFKGCKVDMHIKPLREEDKANPYGYLLYSLKHPETGEPYQAVIKSMVISKPGNPVYVTCTTSTNKPHQVDMRGIAQATYNQARAMLSHAKEIHPHRPAGPSWDDEYEEYYQRIKAGEDKRKVKREFVAKYGTISKQRFDQAMYRRRLREKTNVER